MKKVLLVSCGGLGNGGVQAVMMSIVRNLSCDFIFDTLLFTNEKRFYDDEFLSYGGKIHRISCYEGLSIWKSRLNHYCGGHRLYKKVLNILQEHGPYDVIHCHDEFENGPIIKAAAKMNIPIRISHTHVIAQKSNIIARLLENYRRNTIEKYSTIKIGCSEDACTAFYKNAKSAKVIYNPYDNNRFNISKYHISSKIKFNLLQIGRYCPVKNQLFSIRVVECIKKRYSDIKLTLVGFSMGDYEEKIRRMVKEKNLSKNIILLPSNADTPNLLSQASGFLFPSLHEGFGISLIEAQAMGTYCYSSDNVPKLTDCGGVTYLSLDDGPEKWANKIIEDYELREGVHGHFDVSKFEIENIMKKYKSLYEGDTL